MACWVTRGNRNFFVFRSWTSSGLHHFRISIGRFPRGAIQLNKNTWQNTLEIRKQRRFRKTKTYRIPTGFNKIINCIDLLIYSINDYSGNLFNLFTFSWTYRVPIQFLFEFYSTFINTSLFPFQLQLTFDIFHFI